MIRWLMGIGVVVAIGAGFSWWRFSTLHKLSPSEEEFATTTAELPPATTSRQELLKFEQEILALKAKQLDSVITTSVARGKTDIQVPLPTSTRPAATSSVRALPIQEVVPGVPSLVPPVPPSLPAGQAGTTPTSTAKAPSPPSLQQVLIDGSGFCDYVKGNSAVVLSGYPLPNDVTIPDEDIKTWTTTRVIFFVPDSVPHGTYKVIVRGRDSWGYCAATTSSPAFIKVQ